MINAVFDETHDQHQASARRYSGETLQHRVVDGGNLIQAAAAGDQSDGERLQEIAAQGAADAPTRVWPKNPKPCSLAAVAAKCAPTTPVRI
jgi:hypothetical protein